MRQLQGLPKAFGTVIAKARAKQGLSQEQLAEMIDATNVYISMLENGQRQPSLNAVILIKYLPKESSLTQSKTSINKLRFNKL